MKKILIVNPGSTAVKYSVYSDKREVLVERDFSRKESNILTREEKEWISDIEDISGVGVRVVHGVSQSESSVINNEVLNKIKDGIAFAPIHNAIANGVIEYLLTIFEEEKVIAVFDTAFHKDMPQKAKVYPLPSEITKELKLYRYGFHGLALADIVKQVPKLASENNIDVPVKIIAAHLGGGSSITAIKNGKSIDTTMGVTPLEGLMMITRSGTISSDILEIISNEKGMTSSEVVAMLNNESGFYGITGSKDTLDIIERAEQGEGPYKLAVDIFVYQIVKQIFAYYGAMQGVDALVFSGGIGYGNKYLRGRILEEVKLIGISDKNTFIVDVDEAGVIFDDVLRLIDKS